MTKEQRKQKLQEIGTKLVMLRGRLLNLKQKFAASTVTGAQQQGNH